MAFLERSIPPMALERGFFILELDQDAEPEKPLTNAQALLQVQPRPALWVVVRSRLRPDPTDRKGISTRYFVIEHAKFVQTLIDRPTGGKLATTLGLKFEAATVLTVAQYQGSATAKAVVLQEDTVVGITVARPGAQRTAVEKMIDVAAHIAQGLKGEAFSLQETEGAPHRIDAFLPDTARLNETVSLVITLDQVAAAFATASDVGMHEGETVDFTVRPGPGLELLDSNTLALVAQTDRPSLAAEFKLKAIALGATTAKVYAFNQRRSVALLTLYINVVEPQNGGKVGIDNAGLRNASASLPAMPATHAADLSLLVFEGADSLHFKLHSKAGDVRDFESTVSNNSREYFRQFSALIENQRLRNPQDRIDARRQLEAWGVNLFNQLIPTELQSILWKNLGEVTMQICSDDAWIPWEACRLMRRKAGGTVEEGPFFAEAFAITRWLHGMAAPERFRLSNCALVVPTSSGLTTATKERDFYLRLADPQRRAVTEITPRYAELTQAMEMGIYDAWHFCGHANAGAPGQGDRATLSLDNNDTMSADLFAGTVENALLPRPFIFFNACQSAVGDQALTGVGGWAHRFIRPNFEQRGAAVFIGTYWSVYDGAAYQFATALYKALIEDRKPMGTAVRQARLIARQYDDTPGKASDPLSWLAYTVYADPLAVLETIP